MASFAAACRMSARLTARQMRQDAAAVRGFRTSSSSLAAQSFSMPALSPTMTEGNISKWNLKEGDSFSAGDVLLEIETDKASMDVEAQDDGILAKIVVGDGSKGIQVGSRIAILAEEGDDISSLEIPAEESAPKKEAKSESSEKPKEKEAKQEESKPAKKSSEKKSSSPAPAQTKPFFPSVEALLKEHNLSSSDVSQMTPSGPKGRLIKGDVLAYIGKTSSSSYASELGSRLEKLSHLDLSNIKIPPPKKAAAPEKAAKEAPKGEQRTDVAVQISMKAVLEVQKRIQASLGVFLPISTFINRAVDLANDELPLPKNYKPTADELFNDILGLDSVVTSRGTRGTFVPQIAAFPPTTSLVAPSSRAKSSKKVDVLDQLIAGGKKSAFKKEAPLVPGLSSGDNVFSVSVVKGEEKRAGVFLERVKNVLEGEPGRLVI